MTSGNGNKYIVSCQGGKFDGKITKADRGWAAFSVAKECIDGGYATVCRANQVVKIITDSKLDDEKELKDLDVDPTTIELVKKSQHQFIKSLKSDDSIGQVQIMFYIDRSEELSKMKQKAFKSAS